MYTFPWTISEGLWRRSKIVLLMSNTRCIHQVPAYLYAPVLLGTKAMVMDPPVVPRPATSVRPTIPASMDSVWWVSCLLHFYFKKTFLGLIFNNKRFTVMTAHHRDSWLHLQLQLRMARTQLRPEYQRVPEQSLSERRKLHWCCQRIHVQLHWPVDRHVLRDPAPRYVDRWP